MDSRSLDGSNVAPQISTTSTTVAPGSESGSPPPPAKPPRPLSPREQAEKTLIEAFPSIDVAVVKAVLTASSGNVEPAFDALLGMTDPDSQQEAPPPAKPPRPVQQSAIPTSTAQTQLEADEMYARQLHEHYSGTSRQQRQKGAPNPQAPRPRTQAEEEREYSFLDDDLPMIRDNIRKGFLETQSTVNKWVANFKKKLDGDDDEGLSGPPARPAQVQQGGNPGYSNYVRRSADRERYDADPQVLGDDFSTLELRDSEGKDHHQ
jgi:CUE domain